MELTEEQEQSLKDIEPTIVTREEWNAMKPTAKRKLKNPVEKVVFVHSKSNPCYSKEECIYAVKKLQKHQMEVENRSDIESNFLIGRDGTVLEGRGWNNSASLIEGEDSDDLSGKNLEIAFIGHEMLEPTKYQLRSALGLLVTGIKNKYVSEKVAVYQFEFDRPIFSPPDAESTEDDADGKASREAWEKLDEEEKQKHIKMNEELGKMRIEDM